MYIQEDDVRSQGRLAVRITDGISSQSYSVVGLGISGVKFLVSVTIVLASLLGQRDTSTALSLKLQNLMLFNRYTALNERERQS
jgi:hypothetical protein